MVYFLKFMQIIVRHLDLHSPLEYAEASELDPFDPVQVEGAADQECMFCFELNCEQAERIDPAEEGFLGELIFSGRKTSDQGDMAIPVGLYLFSQQRQVLCRNECIQLAIEQQKDGLWEKYQLKNRLYIRRLFEDGSHVTQLFRPHFPA